MVLVGLRASNKHTRDYKCVLWFDAIDTTNAIWPQIETELWEILPQDISIEICRRGTGFYVLLSMVAKESLSKTTLVVLRLQRPLLTSIHGFSSDLPIPDAVSEW